MSNHEKGKINGQNGYAAKRIAKNSFFLVASRILGLGMQLAMIPLLARYLEVGMFGFFALVVAIAMSIRPVADFGVDRIICREISLGGIENDIYVSTTIGLRMAISIILLVVVVQMIGWFSTWDDTINTALIIAVLTEIIGSMGQTYLSAIRGFERMEFDLFAVTAQTVSVFIFILIVIFFDLGFLAVFYARLMASIIFLMFSAIFLYALFIKPSIRFDIRFAGYMIKESWPILVFSCLLVLIFKIDVFFLQWFGNETDVALFEVPHRLITQMQIFAMAVSFSVFPVLSRYAGSNLKHSLEQYYRNTYKFLMVIGVALSALLYAGGEPFIVTLFGSEFKGAVPSLKILSPTMAFLFLTSLQNMLLVASGRQLLNTVSVAVSLGINIVLDILLIPDYAFIGASIATLISYFVLVVINSYFIYREKIRLGLTGAVGKTAVAGLVATASVLIQLPTDMMTFFVRCSVGLLLYAILIIVFKVLTKQEIAVMKTIIGRKKDSEATACKTGPY